MQVEALAIPEVKIITPQRFADDRGFFSETYNERVFREIGVAGHLVYDNHSASAAVGTVRGLHYQSPPFAQAKLIRVLRGRILDVAVDARKGSPTFGRHVKAELSDETGAQIFVPAGFLHGFITLEPDTHVAYKVDAYYSRECDGAVRFDDPDLGIDWGPAAADAVTSDKDRSAPAWSSFKTPFEYRVDSNQ